MALKQLRRREMIEQSIVRGSLIAAGSLSAPALLAAWQQGEQNAHKPTPSEVLGPFYRKGAPNTAVLHRPGDPGFPLQVTGKLLNTRGEKVPNATIEVWHSDHAGLYDVLGYRYRAKLLIEEASEYTLKTILPGHYPDRPAQHIHYLISAPGHKTLITQAYFATDPFFEGDVDRNYAKRNIVSHRDLVRPVRLYEQGTPRAEITFDIVLERS
jgi:protocatechuate 3,4-dioxygenase beta subunit